MFNAPYADGRGRQAAYYQPPQGLFARQGQLNYGYPAFDPRSLPGHGPNLPAGSHWGMFAQMHQPEGRQAGIGMPQMRNQTPSQMEQYLERQKKMLAEAEKQRREFLKKAEEAAEKAKRDTAEAARKLAESGKPTQAGQSDKKSQAVGQTVLDPKTHPAKAQPPNGKKEEKQHKESGFHGSASTLIGAFKVASALIITGGINAFFFGVPLHTASLVSGLVAGSQSLTALKIHRENNEFSRKLIGFTRKLMGRENDHTPSGKEWSMVPVWGAICGTFGLSEAFLNHMYKKYTGDPPKTLDDRFKDLSDEVKALDAKNAKGLGARFRRFQLKTMTWGRDLLSNLKHYAEKFAKAEKNGVLLQKAGKLANWGLDQAIEFSKKSAGGKKPYVGYIWSFCMASLGGAAQTVIAALMQTKVDKAHGLK